MFEIQSTALLDVRNAELGTGIPPVSVIVTLFNYARFVRECLDSIVSQTHPHLDLVVVDDASTDDSRETVLDWARQHTDRFRRTLVLTHVENQGLAQTRNTAFEHCETEFVFVLDADNSLYPRAIARLADVVQDPVVGVAYSQLEFFGEERRLGDADIWSRERLSRGNYVDAMSLVRKSAWSAVGGYSPMHGWEDYDLWCKFVEADFVGVFVPEILCRYRVHGTSMLRTETTRRRESLAHKMVFRHPWLTL